MEAKQEIEVLDVAIGAVEQIWCDRSHAFRYHVRSRFSPLHRSDWAEFGSAKSQLLVLAVRYGAFEKLVA